MKRLSIHSLAVQHFRDAIVVSEVPSLAEWHRSCCPQCGGRLLIDTGSPAARCAAGCGWRQS